MTAALILLYTGDTYQLHYCLSDRRGPTYEYSFYSCLPDVRIPLLRKFVCVIAEAIVDRKDKKCYAEIPRICTFSVHVHIFRCVIGVISCLDKGSVEPSTGQEEVGLAADKSRISRH